MERNVGRLRMANKITKGFEWYLGAFGIVAMVALIWFTILFFMNVDLVSWLASESYADAGEWYKQLGISLAIFAGLIYWGEWCLSLISELPLWRRNEN